MSLTEEQQLSGLRSKSAVCMFFFTHLTRTLTMAFDAFDT